MSEGNDAVQFSNIAATPSIFVLKGGQYLVSVKAADYGTIKLQQLALDGSTLLDIKRVVDAGTDVAINSWAANGSKTLDLAPGKYQLTVASCTAIYVAITRVPRA